MDKKELQRRAGILTEQVPVTDLQRSSADAADRFVQLAQELSSKMGFLDKKQRQLIKQWAEFVASKAMEVENPAFNTKR